MGTYIILNNQGRHGKKEYAVFDYRPGQFTNDFYNFRDMSEVHNANEKHIAKLSGVRIDVDEWIYKYGIPKCLERFGLSDWIPF